MKVVGREQADLSLAVAEDGDLPAVRVCGVPGLTVLVQVLRHSSLAHLLQVPVVVVHLDIQDIHLQLPIELETFKRIFVLKSVRLCTTVKCE